MARQSNEGTTGAFLSAAQGSWLGDLAWGLVPLGLWGLLALSLLRAVVVGAPAADYAPDAGELSAQTPAAQASALTNR